MASRSPKSSAQKKKHIPNFLEGEFHLPKLEERVLGFWRNNGIFEKSLAEKKGGKFVFYEGPPYANGKPGIHHVLSRVIKDVILRYKTMRGYHVPRRAGWDTHGLPVEMAAEKALGIRSKKEIEKYGVKLFNEKAKEQVWLYKDEWERLTERIGYWLDLKNAYITYEPEYIETLWWTLAQIARSKKLYKGHKVVPWCTRCGTALSSHELAQGYKETVDTSVYVKFKIAKGQRIGNFIADDATYILSWTTTPWTLPGNVALAVGEKIPYVFVRTMEPKESYIVAKDLAAAVLKDTDFAVMGEIEGRRLVGLEYTPLFDVISLRSPLSYKIYAADFVTTTDGTGVVHTAVMYGEDDYVLGKKIGLPEHHTVDEEGKFTKEIRGLAGEYVKSKDAEERIFRQLQAQGNLLRTESYTHEYPYCWRCGTAVLYYARTSWFIAMAKLRAELLKRNKNIHWTPDHVKSGRFGEWLREAKDWNLSRERYWGAPLPIWECKKCGHMTVVESLDVLDKLGAKSKNHYWVMRHGEAENNIFNIIDDGEKKLHLTPRGRKQVAASIARFKKQLSKEHKHIDLVITSDVLRTEETEKIVAEALTGEKVKIDSQLEEIRLGPTLEGCHDEKYHVQFPSYASRFEQAPPDGESLRMLRGRLWKFLEECEKKYHDKNILLITHEYPIWMLTHIAEGWSEKRAIREKEKIDNDKERRFVDFAEIRPLHLKSVPRNESGEVDLHRPFIDEIVLPCSKCHAEMHRVPEVADVWYDSGAMPFAQAHYPFESKTNTKTLSGLDYPADYISEGMDQTRGWFYTLLAIATALGYKAPYKNVIALGLINDKMGQKMSKSKGNIVEPFAIMEKYGVDALRWYFYTGSPLGEPKNFDEDEIAKAFRRTHLIVYNSFVFWKTYADVKSAGKVSGKSSHVLDKWILARLNETADVVARRLDAYEIREAALALESLVDDLSRWYIRRSRRRLQKPESAKDYRAASETLGYVLLSLVKMMAPFTPFFAEGLYTPLGGQKESIHLDEWPKADKKAINKKLIASMAAARNFSALGLAKRAEAGIKVRQPLASMKIGMKLAKEFAHIVAEEVNVKKILVAPKLKNDVELDTVITAELREEGVMRDVVRMFQELRQKANLSPKDKVIAMVDFPEEIKTIVSRYEVTFKSDIGAKNIEYKRSDKFQAEESTKLDGKEVWIGLRKV